MLISVISNLLACSECLNRTWGIGEINQEREGGDYTGLGIKGGEIRADAGLSFFSDTPYQVLPVSPSCHAVIPVTICLVRKSVTCQLSVILLVSPHVSVTNCLDGTGKSWQKKQ